MLGIGLMSGTSLDGIDAALVDIENSGPESKVKLVDFTTESFSEEIKKEIENALSLDQSNVKLICSLNFKLGKLFSEACKKICEKNQLTFDQIDFIGSHGQTIYHLPFTEANFIPSSLQIGEAAVIAYETNTTVVSNFRTMDMAAGGQGAPLVPYTEMILYGDPEKNRLLQNIGGIGNVTLLPKQGSMKQTIAFDTGPGNMIIDEACRRLFDVSYDEKGGIAEYGRINEEMLKYCMDSSYIQTPPPKSTGRELYGRKYTSDLIAKFSHVPKYDFITTATMFTAMSIAENYRKFIFPKIKIDEVIIGGGGSRNETLVSMIRELLKEECKVLVQEDIGYSSDAKEAVAFAVLANETLQGNPSNIPSATGAKEPVILGSITLPPRATAKY
ncbi:anhydro-N-acetylmuramic acid kinase AnmK [Fictibacillus sp. B-59209]|uniref:anhydro-N-acetylmuramic acid kinase AnmK n=1 Tax=Fictibacillus sp. B-59209 TaxID=3024873 RepID=UPI002E1BD964|nr:anhydro-N-acetylmuramic acid kinase AnmK [Fictibacillus sp. B-59209]